MANQKVYTTAAGCSSVSSNALFTLRENLSKRTDALLLGLDLIISHHGASNEVRAQMNLQIHGSLDISASETVWLQRCKHLLTYPLAKYLRNEAPPPPDSPFRPSGCLRAWMKQRLVCFNRRNTHLWYSWFQGKRCTLPVSEEFVESTYKKHFATLTRPDPGCGSTIDKIFSEPTFKEMIKIVRKHVKELYAEEQLGHSSYGGGTTSYLSATPSGSACFERSRASQGQFGELQELADLSHYPSTRSETRFDTLGQSYVVKYQKKDRPIGRLILTTDLLRMDLVVRFYMKNGPRSFVVKEVRAPSGREDWENLLSYSAASQRSLVDGSAVCSATIQAVLEPNKVRVISKGPALPYYYCKPLQKILLKAIQSISSFRLTGRPFCPTDLIGLKKKAGPYDQWYSVDYSAATDGLSWKYSQRILEAITRDLPHHDREMMESVLGPHDLFYPSQDGEMSVSGCPQKFGRQQNGQLMGSILSFPILCLANMGVYLLVTSGLHAGWTYRERFDHVLVNGDDMVYAAPKSHWQRHSYFASKVGLEMSVGKAYVHPVYANINSVSVHYDLQDPSSTPWQIDYLNVGLFFGVHKVQSATQTLDPDIRNKKVWNQCHPDLPPLVILDKQGEETLTLPEFSGTKFDTERVPLRRMTEVLGKCDFNPELSYESILTPLNKVLSGSLPGKSSQILCLFLKTHSNVVRSEQSVLVAVDGKLSFFKRNLFLPISLGGMGIDCPHGFKNEITPIQRKIARSILTRFPGVIHNSQRPILGYDIDRFEELSPVPWVRSVRAPEIQLYSPSSSQTFFCGKKRSLLSYQDVLSSWTPNCFI